jgi:predicted restriction endonuclease
MCNGSWPRQAPEFCYIRPNGLPEENSDSLARSSDGRERLCWSPWACTACGSGVSAVGYLVKRIEAGSDVRADTPEEVTALQIAWLQEWVKKCDHQSGDFDERCESQAAEGYSTAVRANGKASVVKVRRSQQFFRQTILNIYQHRCCVTGIAVPELLIASHILPWGKFPEERLNPQNGLCLSSIHDAAFDCGLVSFDDKLCLILSRKLEGYFPDTALEKNFAAYAGKKISETEKLSEPKREFLRCHREEIFRN